MATKRGKKARKKKSGPSWWSSLDPARKRGLFRLSLGSTVAVAGILLALLLTQRLEAHVDTLILASRPTATLYFEDMPAAVATLAEGEIRDRTERLLSQDWTDDGLCRSLAETLQNTAWVEAVNHVRRTHDATFLASCRYRIPAAQVQIHGEFFLVDRRGTRLPGSYRHDPQRLLIQGVATQPPAEGRRWVDPRLRAGLDLVGLIQNQPYSHQITAVLVDNVGGTLDPRKSHVELATEQAGGRIRWGSAPGAEIEENTVQQKLQLLEANYHRTGRVDAGFAVIDVSTFADRFTVPG